MKGVQRIYLLDQGSIDESHTTLIYRTFVLSVIIGLTQFKDLTGFSSRLNVLVRPISLDFLQKSVSMKTCQV